MNSDKRYERALSWISDLIDEFNSRPRIPFIPAGGSLKHRYLKRKGRDQFLNVNVNNGEVSINGNQWFSGKWKGWFTFEEIAELDDMYGVLNEFEIVL